MKIFMFLWMCFPIVLLAQKQENKVYFQIGEFKEVHNPAWNVTDDPWCINDHTFIYNPDTKRWHVIGITHSRNMDYIKDPGINLLHISADSLFQTPWEIHSHALTADPEKHKESVLWAPYCIFHKGKYYLYACAGGQQGAHIHDAYQINLYLSDDLFTWKRYQNNPLLTDGFDARDPVVLPNGKQWILYYTANSTPQGGNHIIAAYTSNDLLHWDNRKIVFTHPKEGTFGGPTESPFVLKRGNWYYMFLCDGGHTDVYRSDDPFHFEYENLIVEIQDCRASEIIKDNEGNYFISSAGWFGGNYGLKIAPLTWLDGINE